MKCYRNKDGIHLLNPFSDYMVCGDAMDTHIDEPQLGVMEKVYPQPITCPRCIEMINCCGAATTAEAAGGELCKTRDGVTVVPGMKVYFWFGPSFRIDLYERTVKSVQADGWLNWVEKGPERGRCAEDCYSTSKAAEAAKGVNEDD